MISSAAYIMLAAWAVAIAASVLVFGWLARADLKYANEELIPMANWNAREMRVVHAYWAENDDDPEMRRQHSEWVKKLDVIIMATGGSE